MAMEDLDPETEAMIVQDDKYRKEELEIARMNAENDKRAIELQSRPPSPFEGRAISFDERQMQFLYNTQPKKQDMHDNIGWNHRTFLQTEILRHIQLTNMPTELIKAFMRELKDCLVMSRIPGMEEVAQEDLASLYVRVLIQKSANDQGRPTDRELLQTTISKQHIEQKIPQEPQRKTGFLNELLGRK